MRKTDERFTFEELKDLGFDFSAYSEIPLTEFLYFLVSYENQQIVITGYLPEPTKEHRNHYNDILAFFDDLASYHIEKAQTKGAGMRQCCQTFSAGGDSVSGNNIAGGNIGGYEMTRQEQKDFIISQLDATKNSILKKIESEDIPEYWEGKQLRQYISDCQLGGYFKLSKSEKAKYNNDLAIGGNL